MKILFFRLWLYLVIFIGPFVDLWKWSFSKDAEIIHLSNSWITLGEKLPFLRYLWWLDFRQLTFITCWKQSFSHLLLFFERFLKLIERHSSKFLIRSHKFCCSINFELCSEFLSISLQRIVKHFRSPEEVN